jgi:hypothetical protein
MEYDWAGSRMIPSNYFIGWLRLWLVYHNQIDSLIGYASRDPTNT